ncbi:hypothetical protein Ancab_021480, partial [Ancistrocladus abbreviatus]
WGFWGWKRGGWDRRRGGLRIGRGSFGNRARKLGMGGGMGGVGKGCLEMEVGDEEE